MDIHGRHGVNMAEVTGSYSAFQHGWIDDFWVGLPGYPPKNLQRAPSITSVSVSHPQCCCNLLLQQVAKASCHPRNSPKKVRTQRERRILSEEKLRKHWKACRFLKWTILCCAWQKCQVLRGNPELWQFMEMMLANGRVALAAGNQHRVWFCCSGVF